VVEVDTEELKSTHIQSLRHCMFWLPLLRCGLVEVRGQARDGLRVMGYGLRATGYERIWKEDRGAREENYLYHVLLGASVNNTYLISESEFFTMTMVGLRWDVGCLCRFVRAPGEFSRQNRRSVALNHLRRHLLVILVILMIQILAEDETGNSFLVMG
jgi:hypothetical protein